MTSRVVPLIEMPETVPIARTLSGATAQERLTAYENYIAGFQSEKARKSLGVLSYNSQTGDLEGANLFSSIALAQLAPEGTRITGLEDWGRIVSLDEDFFKDIYAIAPEVILRSRGDSHTPNAYVARDLAEKLRIKSFDKNISLVVSGLDLEEDEESEYGLVLTPTTVTKVIEAPVLAYEEGNAPFRFSITDENGIPIPDEDGKHTCHLREDGISRFSRYRRVLLSRDGVLADSDRYGRVVEVSAEGAAQNFSAYATKILKAQTDLEKRAEEIASEAVSRLEALK